MNHFATYDDYLILYKDLNLVTPVHTTSPFNSTSFPAVSWACFFRSSSIQLHVFLPFFSHLVSDLFFNANSFSHLVPLDFHDEIQWTIKSNAHQMYAQVCMRKHFIKKNYDGHEATKVLVSAICRIWSFNMGEAFPDYIPRN